MALFNHKDFFDAFSRELNVNILAFNRKLTAVVMALQHFCYFVESRNFTIYTDPKPIVTAIQSEADSENALQAGQLAYISEFTTDIRYFLPGTSNVVADALSRQEINALFQHNIQIDWEKFDKAHAHGKELLHFLNNDHSLKIKKFPVAL